MRQTSLLFAFFALMPSVVAAQSPRPLGVDDLFEIRRVGRPPS